MFCCRGKRLANYLIEHGSKIVRIDCDQKAKGFLVFIFEDDDSIKKNLKQWEVDKKTYLI
ncbi:MAG: hypothetical protein PHN69_08290 [Candidatus Pacebacteria bacterium]|nr:hypothetical protein [Candidatus Paceibacterota bacterium]